MIATYYAAKFAAEGGPGASLPEATDRGILGSCDSGSLGLAFDHGRKTWVVADSQGQVFAEATDPGDLAMWLHDYAECLGAMYRAGELG